MTLGSLQRLSRLAVQHTWESDGEDLDSHHRQIQQVCAALMSRRGSLVDDMRACGSAVSMPTHEHAGRLSGALMRSAGIGSGMFHIQEPNLQLAICVAHLQRSEPLPLALVRAATNHRYRHTSKLSCLEQRRH